MRLRWTLMQIALLAMTGCSSTGAIVSDARDSGTADDASVDGGPPEVDACGGCNRGTPSVTSGNATSAQACLIASGAGAPLAPCENFCTHAAMTRRLARRYAGTPRPPVKPADSPVRALVAIAIENAVEGCVREAYGAVVGLLEAESSRGAEARRTMRSIAADECRHAKLASAVAAWIGAAVDGRSATPSRARRGTRSNRCVGTGNGASWSCSRSAFGRGCRTRREGTRESAMRRRAGGRG